ncbi:acyltransferase [Reinekea marinisedimentorum]|uniref:Transferase family hexapeptide repeat protein n=1 Tax=Reinekea marinisedimentorum TaxID=230495 RepID=A0A4R3I3Z4_9GAMM|nr:acyltransferase [Reinekea marinisedimentorum]TCS40446.1 transferase family hexapeptide repeat protein [Reinekea marinisedimentorum]
MSVQQKHGGELTDEEFRKFTLYCNQSNNQQDDSLRAQILGQTGEGVRIAPGAVVRIKGNQIGKKSYVGLYSYVNGDVAIGENVLIGPHVSIVASNHMYSPEDDFFSARSDETAGKVIIEDGVWLTSGVVVTPGCTIGRCALVCANAVVTKDVPPYGIAAGSPAKIIGRIDRDSGEYHWFKKGEQEC